MATRKKAKGRQAVRNSSNGIPGWSWALIGILAGALLMAFAMRGSWMPMMRQHDGPEPNPQATAQKGSDPGVVDQTEPEKPKKPSYDFYSVLSEKEVRIPDAEIRAQASAEAQQKQQQQQAAQQQAAAQKAEVAQQQQATTAAAANLPKATTQTVTAAPAQQAPAATAAGGSGYLLQVGAFPSAADAEALKAKLALQGFVANVQAVKVGAQTYNRVRLGPFKSATDLESTKQHLQAAGISAIALKEGS
ncbi:cell division protein FtsN [Luteibacter sp. OK325]|uniref:SPOR domain-containing protein n=1 Tax=Luteibacter sp. OK325 TaxID=2135670 RepID=UPI000D3567E1|nr:SPOR domain-containing protein [Luteibacter sp. OK325]PTR32463.1 cell division protein FtsN [Luteibacter sp. OK325]